MYPPALAETLRAAGIDAGTVAQLGLAGRSDPDVFAAAIAHDRAVLSENVADFARISADHLAAGGHHPGVLIALSSRFSRRPAGYPRLVAAIREASEQSLQDRLVYLRNDEG